MVASYEMFIATLNVITVLYATGSVVLGRFLTIGFVPSVGAVV